MYIFLNGVCETVSRSRLKLSFTGYLMTSPEGAQQRTLDSKQMAIFSTKASQIDKINKLNREYKVECDSCLLFQTTT